MPHIDFITDYIDIYDWSWNIVYKNVWSYGNLSEWKWIIPDTKKIIEETYYFIRVLSNWIKEEYIIHNVDYKSHPKEDFFNYIHLQVYKRGKNLEKNPTNIINNIQTNNGIVWENHWVQNIIQITNDLDAIIKVINAHDIENKENYLEILKELKDNPRDKSKLKDLVELIANGTTITSALAVPIMTFLINSIN